MDDFNYHLKCIEFNNKCWASGPTKDSLPKKPEEDLESLVKKDKKRKQKASSNSKPLKVKVKAFDHMSDDEFNEHLKGKIINIINIESKSDPVKMTSSDLDDVAKCLNDVYGEVKQSDLLSLCNHIKLGKHLIKAKEIFDLQKRTNKTRDTWAVWVKTNTKISEAYARQHKEVASLICKYPKLSSLGISFVELFSIKNKIKDVFVRNIQLGEWWEKE